MASPSTAPAVLSELRLGLREHRTSVCGDTVFRSSSFTAAGCVCPNDLLLAAGSGALAETLAAKKNRERIKMHTGTPVLIGARPPAPECPQPTCPHCESTMRLVDRISRHRIPRASPGINVLRFA